MVSAEERCQLARLRGIPPKPVVGASHRPGVMVLLAEHTDDMQSVVLIEILPKVVMHRGNARVRV